MIVSASRRTDIPALYADWFFNRLAAGEVRVPNPMNPKQVRLVSLRPGDVDGFVFWSKDPARMLDRLPLPDRTPFYVQYTLTPYGPGIEPGTPEVGRRVETMLRLADRIGPDRLTWRYDPVLLNPDWTPERHEEAFGQLTQALRGAVRQCVFSFLDRYRKIEGALLRLGVSAWTPEGMRDMAERLARIAAETGLALETCAEEIDLSALGIGRARCVDAVRLTGRAGRKDPNQREACGCSASVDIGMYQTCVLDCAYCYANSGKAAARRGFEAHDPDSPQLSGRP